MNKTFYILILLLSFFSCKTDAKLKSEYLQTAKSDKIDTVGIRYLELNRFSGSILATKEGKIIYKNNFGLADYENNKPFKDNTTFKIGEISELITANMIREMAEKNELKLSDKVSKHLPKIEGDFTINDLLNHNTNFPSIQMIQEQNPNLKYATIKFANLAAQSSDTAKKSDLDYNILGVVIEKISGKSFQNNVESYSRNLGLENTYFQKSDSTLAVGYLFHNYRGKGLELQKAPVSTINTPFSSNGLKSTSSDLAKILIENSAKKVDIDGYLVNDGFSYSIQTNPKTNTAVIVLSNRRHPIAKEISNSVTAILENREYTLPLSRKPVDIDKNLLKDYSGFYSLNENMNLEVLNENDSLFVMMGPNKIHLVPQSSNQFYMKEMDASIRFVRDSANSVNEAVLLDGFLDGNRIKRVEK